MPFFLEGKFYKILLPMETRKERYSKYRQEILRMPKESFDKNGSFCRKMNVNELSSISSMGTPESSISYMNENEPFYSSEKNRAPYLFYLKKRRAFLWLKLSILALIIIFLVLLYFFFVREQA